MKYGLICYIACFYSCLCYAQKAKSIVGTYFSKDTLHPATLILKPGSDKSISGILITGIGREYIYFVHKGNQLNGSFIPNIPLKAIQATITSDSTINVVITDNDIIQHFALSKLKIRELDLSGAKYLDPILFGKWIYFDEKKRGLIHNQYFIYNPNGSLEFSDPRNPNVMNSDIVRSGRIKLKWITQDQRIYALFETNLPLSINNVALSTYRVVNDTLYMTNHSGKVHKAVRDKSFMP